MADPRGRAIETTLPLSGSTHRKGYTEDGLLQRIVRPREQVYEAEDFDHLGRPRRVRQGDAVRTAFTYDVITERLLRPQMTASGRALQETLPAGKETTVRGSTPAHREVLRVLQGRAARTFLEANPWVWYDELGRDLGTRLAPIRLKEGLGLACKSAGDLEWFARDVFVRELRRSLPAGWIRATEVVGGPLNTAWAALGFIDDVMSEHADRAVGYLLGALFIPDGWLPESPDDPHLLEAFDATRLA